MARATAFLVLWMRRGGETLAQADFLLPRRRSRSSAGAATPRQRVGGSPGARFENLVALHLLKARDAWNDLGLGDFGLH
jgi:hypothetical protein